MEWIHLVSSIISLHVRNHLEDADYLIESTIDPPTPLPYQMPTLIISAGYGTFIISSDFFSFSHSTLFLF